METSVMRAWEKELVQITGMAFVMDGVPRKPTRDARAVGEDQGELRVVHGGGLWLLSKGLHMMW